MNCKKCGQRPARGRSGMCKECKSEYNREWYQKNKDKHKANVAKNNAARLDAYRKVVLEFKSQPCSDCGETFPPVCMDFDHLEDHDKVANIAHMGTWSLETLRTEIAKCEVVCANCHRIRTHNRRG